MSDTVQNVGARMTLLDGAKFRSELAASTDQLKAFNDEQERSAELATSTSKTVVTAYRTQAAAVTENSATVTDTLKAQRDAQLEVADTAEASSKRVAVAAEASAVMVTASNKVLKYGAVAAAATLYEGIKSANAFQQQISQTAIDAGVKKSQLPAFTKMALQIANATGVAATNVADMMYRIASANPKIGITTAAMKEMVTQASNLVVLQGAGGNADATARMYGAIVSNGLSLNRGGKALTYNAASAKAINEWDLATVGHGDMQPADLVAAMGTGLLPVAKTYGLGLNDIGAMLDVLSPAMSATSASTRLKTAIGMLGSPSQKASQAMEVIGGSGTTLGNLLRTNGATGSKGLLSYLATAMNTPWDNGSFVGGGIFGAASGKYSGTAGIADWLKAYGFTNAGLVSELQSVGPGGLKKMSSSQLQSLGFIKGTTGTQAYNTISADLIGQMFGGGHTGAAIMQLVNEKGTAASKYAIDQASETPKSYTQALGIAFAEPAVKLHQFEQQLKNLTIEVGQDVSPKFDDFLDGLEKLGAWFGHNKWAIDSLLTLGGVMVAGAGAIKLASMAGTVVRGGTSIVKAVLNPGSSLKTLFTGGTSLSGAAGEVAKGGLALQRAAGALMGDDAKLGTASVGMDADDIALAGGSTGLFSKVGKVLGAANLAKMGAIVGIAGFGASEINKLATGNGKHAPKGPIPYVSHRGFFGDAIWDINAAGNGLINGAGSLVGMDPHVNVGDASWSSRPELSSLASIDKQYGSLNDLSDYVKKTLGAASGDEEKDAANQMSHAAQSHEHAAEKLTSAASLMEAVLSQLSSETYIYAASRSGRQAAIARK